MNNNFLLEAYAKHRQDELLREAEQSRLVKEARGRHPTEAKRRHFDVRQMIARAPKLYCRLFTWVMRGSHGF